MKHDLSGVRWYGASPRRFGGEYIIVGAPADRAEDLYRWLEVSLPTNGQAWEMDIERVRTSRDRLLRPYHMEHTVSRTLRMLAERRWPQKMVRGKPLEEGDWLIDNWSRPPSDDWSYLSIDSPRLPLEEDEIVGVSEIAAYAGVEGPTVEKWTRRHADFPQSRPKPIGGRPAWNLMEVAAWLWETGRLDGTRTMEDWDPAPHGAVAGFGTGICIPCREGRDGCEGRDCCCRCRAGGGSS